MKKFKELYYLIEEVGELGELPPVYKRAKKLIDIIETLPKEEKDKLASDPNGYGSKFWPKVEDLMKELNSSVKNPNSVLQDEDEVIKELQNQLKTNFSKMYDFFKPTFDRISPVVAAASTEEDPNDKDDVDFTTPVAEVPSAEEDDHVLLPGEEAPSAEEAPSTEEAPSNFSDESIIDYLDSKGEPSDYASRSKLAADYEIDNYRGSREQNLELLGKLKSGEPPISKDTSPSTATKTGETPKIKFNGVEQTAYVDMGGGKYVPATEDQLGDPNTQLYVKNPKRGQTEYLKPTYVKVRREGNELRRQSQFGGALGSLSNLFGDIGNSLKN